MKTSTLYHWFFPEDKPVRFAKIKWTIMVILQEMMMGKWKAIFKYFWKPSYHRDINKVRDILCKGKMYGIKTQVRLCDIKPSHEINYPKLVDKLERDIIQGKTLPRLKVFMINEFHYIVIDGNHRLLAYKKTYPHMVSIDVLELKYK